MKLAWFGHQSNLPALYEHAPALWSRAPRHAFELAVVSAPGFGAEEFCELFNHYHGRRCRAHFHSWSLQETWSTLASCDAVIIPSAATDSTKRAKSANRVVESLRAGRLAIAHPLPAYAELDAYCMIETDLAHGIERALSDPDAALRRVQAGRAYVDQHYSPEHIGARWERVLRDALDESR